MDKRFSAWWKLTGDDIAKSIGDDLHGNHEYATRRSLWNSYENLYMNRFNSTDSGPLGALGAEIQSICGGEESRVPYNLMRKYIESALAHTSNIQPIPEVVTSGASASMQRKGQLATRWLQATFDVRNVEREFNQSKLDCALFGTGILHVFQDGDKPCIERVYPGQIILDEHECLHTSKPRRIMRRMVLDRDVLKYKFPDRAEEIEKAGFLQIDALRYDKEYSHRADQIDVVEAWKLPSGRNAGDGKHVVVVDGLTLLEESYDYEDLPFVFIKWSEAPSGFWGTGLGEILVGSHIDYNVALTNIKQARKYTASPYIFVPEGSIDMESFGNEPGTIIPYAGGVPPQFVAPLPTSPQDYQHLQYLDASAAQISGNSAASFDNQVNTRLETGAAVRSMADIQTRRFKFFGEYIQEARKQVARLLLRVGKELYDGNKKNVVVAAENNAVEEVPWDDLSFDIKDEAYLFRVLPVSNLSDSLAGRLDEVQSMINSQLIGPTEGRKLLNLPDMAAHEDRFFADERRIELILENIVVKGEYAAPDAYIPAPKALALAIQEMNRVLILKDVPEKNKSMLQTFINECMAIVQEQQALAQQQALAAQQAAGGPESQ